jgi:peroxiredoxin
MSTFNPLNVGDTLPDASFVNWVNGNLQQQNTEHLFAGKKAIVFALPGAFTPICSAAHLPGYAAAYDDFMAQSIDIIYCLCVNDAFVMESWKKNLSITQDIEMLCDGNGDFTEAMGLLVNKRPLGFGLRSWRYSMVVDDRVIKKLFIEDIADTGDPFAVSDAQTMLAFLKGEREG